MRSDAIHEGVAVYYPDLSHECQADGGRHVRAVGWLSSDHPFPTGKVSPEFLDALRRHVLNPWQPVFFMGMHLCEFCPPRRDGRLAMGSRNVWIPAASVVYVAPELVLHYIETHGYCPPDCFIAAVLDCPEQDSAAYREQMRHFPLVGGGTD